MKYGNVIKGKQMPAFRKQSPEGEENEEEGSPHRKVKMADFRYDLS